MNWIEYILIGLAYVLGVTMLLTLICALLALMVGIFKLITFIL